MTGSSSFSLFYLQSSTGSSDPTNDWMDYPTLGIDKFALYIGANIFDKATHTVNKGSSLYLVNKASLLAGSLSFTAWQYGTGAGKSGSNGIANVGMLTPQGVQNDDPAATEGYFIATDWAAFGSLIIKRVTDPGGSPSLSADIVLTVPTTSESIDQSASGTPGNIYTMHTNNFNVKVFPNPATDIVTVAIKSPADQFVIESLADFTGKALFEKNVHLLKGMNEVQFSIASFPAGTYFLQIKNSGLQVLQTVKIIKA